MDIPNLSSDTIKNTTPKTFFSPLTLTIVIVLSLFTGFWLSRFFPNVSPSNFQVTPTNEPALSTDKISSPDEIKVGKVYGNIEKSFKDFASGIVEKGAINGEGTHILNREGGLSQRASLTSSAVDLDLFVGKKVEVKGETNASTKTAWLLDVGSIKVIE